MILDILLTRYNYVVVALLLPVGAYMMIENRNLVKKVIGMNVFQTGIFLFFITAAYREGASPPLVGDGGAGVTYVSPLPHVLILTAIVVGVSLTAVALALIVRIYAQYGTLDERRLREAYADE
nr:cation:proton antiporter subunit C [Halobium salinum]